MVSSACEGWINKQTCYIWGIIWCFAHSGFKLAFTNGVKYDLFCRDTKNSAGDLHGDLITLQKNKTKHIYMKMLCLKKKREKITTIICCVMLMAVSYVNTHIPIPLGFCDHNGSWDQNNTFVCILPQNTRIEANNIICFEKSCLFRSHMNWYTVESQND